jgi:hypothetical protein
MIPPRTACQTVTSLACDGFRESPVPDADGEYDTAASLLERKALKT